MVGRTFSVVGRLLLVVKSNVLVLAVPSQLSGLVQNI